MSNFIVTGSGRSGTSMVTGILAAAGYHTGDDYIPPRRANAQGFFEDNQINRINDAIIGRMIGVRRHLARCWGLRRLLPPCERHRDFFWLSYPAQPRRPVVMPQRILGFMTQRLAAQPFAYKDPRFSITLPVWRPLLPANTRFLAVFRDPHPTVDSIRRELPEGYSTVGPLSPRYLYRSWYEHYSHLLDQESAQGEWLFVHYADILEGGSRPAVERFIGQPLDWSSVDPKLSRAQGIPPTRQDRWIQACADLYARLKERAQADRRTWSNALTAAPEPVNGAM
jgi:hypothetical protein